ncbi:hypothetical protein H312_02050 [Anncaliia algerae PRA339]|uniref:Rab-GAP TBC domain-containing protein n=1 Tax=Anncaliia algerae PRA339 TaxID=1288291 RepID=A0A059EZV7_9MICR|nr:hypothetical protein H312_02050 [Anncaliia algerae PRA339]
MNASCILNILKVLPIYETTSILNNIGHETIKTSEVLELSNLKLKLYNVIYEEFNHNQNISIEDYQVFDNRKTGWYEAVPPDLSIYNHVKKINKSETLSIIYNDIERMQGTINEVRINREQYRYKIRKALILFNKYFEGMYIQGYHLVMAAIVSILTDTNHMIHVSFFVTLLKRNNMLSLHSDLSACNLKIEKLLKILNVSIKEDFLSMFCSSVFLKWYLTLFSILDIKIRYFFMDLVMLYKVDFIYCLSAIVLKKYYPIENIDNQQILEETFFGEIKNLNGGILDHYELVLETLIFINKHKSKITNIIHSD